MNVHTKKAVLVGETLGKIAVTGLLLLAPVFALADTSTTVTASPSLTPAQIDASTQQITTRLSQLQAQIAGVLGTSTPSFLGAPQTILWGQSIQEPDNALTIKFVTLEHTNVSSITPFIPSIELAKFTFQYNSCAAATSSNCVNTYPAVPADLKPGDSTLYQNYDITLVGFSSTTATIIIRNDTLFQSFQNQLNSAAQAIRNLLAV